MCVCVPASVCWNVHSNMTMDCVYIMHFSPVQTIVNVLDVFEVKVYYVLTFFLSLFPFFQGRLWHVW